MFEVGQRGRKGEGGLLLRLLVVVRVEGGVQVALIQCRRGRAVYGAERLERNDASARHEHQHQTPPTVIQDMQNTGQARDTGGPKVIEEKYRK